MPWDTVTTGKLASLSWLAEKNFEIPGKFLNLKKDLQNFWRKLIYI
jgi:hypothetical protein